MTDPRASQQKTIAIDGILYLVRRTPILCSREVVYSVWTPISGGFFNSSHGTHMNLDAGDGLGERWFGRVGTERLTPELDALPARSVERRLAVEAWHASLYARAYMVIEQGFPGVVAQGTRCMGEVSVWTAAG